MKLKFNLQVTPISWKATLGQQLYSLPSFLHPSARIQRRGWGPLCSVKLHLNQQQKAFSWPQKCQELGQPAAGRAGKTRGERGREGAGGGSGMLTCGLINVAQSQRTDQVAACGRVSASQAAAASLSTTTSKCNALHT